MGMTKNPTTAEQVWIEASGFGDAEVYVNDLLVGYLRDENRSFNSDGTRFAFVDERTGRVLGSVTRDETTTKQIAAIWNRK